MWYRMRHNSIRPIRPARATGQRQITTRAGSKVVWTAAKYHGRPHSISRIRSWPLTSVTTTLTPSLRSSPSIATYAHPTSPNRFAGHFSSWALEKNRTHIRSHCKWNSNTDSCVQPPGDDSTHPANRLERATRSAGMFYFANPRHFFTSFLGGLSDAWGQRKLKSVLEIVEALLAYPIEVVEARVSSLERIWAGSLREFPPAEFTVIVVPIRATRAVSREVKHDVQQVPLPMNPPIVTCGGSFVMG